MTDRIRYRDAVPGDVPLILELTRELADYERLDHEVTATDQDIATSLFGPQPRAQVIIAEVDGAPAGQAVWYYTYSTFVGRPGLFVEDIYVRPAYRNMGIGRGFFRLFAARAVAEKCGRIEWAVLDWNAPSIAFYRSLGAQKMDGWTLYRLTGRAIGALLDQAR